MQTGNVKTRRTKCDCVHLRSCQSRDNDDRAWRHNGHTTCSVYTSMVIQYGRWCSTCTRWIKQHRHHLRLRRRHHPSLIYHPFVFHRLNRSHCWLFISFTTDCQTHKIHQYFQHALLPKWCYFHAYCTSSLDPSLFVGSDRHQYLTFLSLQKAPHCLLYRS